MNKPFKVAFQKKAQVAFIACLLLITIVACQKTTNPQIDVINSSVNSQLETTANATDMPWFPVILNYRQTVSGAPPIQADVFTIYTVDLSYTSANPAVTTATTATGSAVVTLNETQKTVTVTGTFQDLSGPATAAHIHGPAAIGSNAGVVVGLTATAATSGTLSLPVTPLTSAQVAAMKAGMHYINIHTAANASGEVRGQIDNVPADIITTYTVGLSYTNANPAVTASSIGTGSAVVMLNETQKTVTVTGTFQDLSGPATAAHIHGPAAIGSNAGVVVGLTATAASSGTLSLPATILTDAQIADMKAGMHYINIHTAANAPGEVRGQIN